MTVYLVGAGPGDPGLITVRGAELLAGAEVVVHDRLSAAELLDLVPPDAERIDVGKSPGHHTMTQDDICALLVERGRAGQSVVRLKGGDPYVFARGGEEAAALMAAGVAFEVVPGITSALAVPASAGIPVTLRYSSTSFTVVTGHEDPSRTESSVNWDAAARIGGTLVLLMAVARWPAISERLLAGGMAPDTPAAAVQWGTRPHQRTVRATLATLGDHDLASPSVIVVGDVASQDLNWFERRPLFGATVVVTRARRQASELVRRLRELGATTVEVPAIEIVEPADGGAALRAAVADIASFDWLVLTSPNGAERFFAHVPDARALGGVQVAAIGAGTAAAIERCRVRPDLVPERYVAESLLEAFPPPPPDGRGRVLLARAAVARDVLPVGLRAAGWDVTVVDAYRAIPPVIDDGVRRSVAEADAITFTSSSTVTNFVAVLGTDALPPVVACIGPVTAATARDEGIDVDIEAGEHTIEGLVEALLAHLGDTGCGVTALEAVVFDFDGTLMDTEWSIFEMAEQAFGGFGVTLTVEAWAAVVGLSDGVWWDELCRANGWDVDRAAWWTTYEAIDRSFRSSIPLVDGVTDLLDELDAAGVAVAVASSSRAEWIEGHLGRVGLLDRFAAIAGADRTGGPGKPAPDVYLLACADLGVDPAGAIAAEDSRHGIASAQAAGLGCVVVPSRITRHTDLSAADLSIPSLSGLTVAMLRGLVAGRSPDVLAADRPSIDP